MKIKIRRNVIITISVIAIALILIFGIMLNPSISPLSFIRDSDGDGFSDSIDEYPDDPEHPWKSVPFTTYYINSISNGKRVTIVSIQGELFWNDVKIQLTDGTNIAEWSPETADLIGGMATSANYSTDILGSLIVCCVVFDISGNGFVSGSDYFQIFTFNRESSFSPSVEYKVGLFFEVKNEKIGTWPSFNG